MPGKVEVPMSWFPLMPNWCFFTYDSEAGAYWGAWGWYEVWEAFGIPAYRGEEMRSMGDMGCIYFSNKQEGMCGQQMRARSKTRTGARRRTRRGRCSLGLHGCFRCPHSGQGEGTNTHTCTHTHTCAHMLQHLSLQSSLEEIMLQHLSVNQCLFSLKCWALDSKRC